MEKLIVIVLSVLLAQISVFGQAQEEWAEYIEVINEKLLNTEHSEFSPHYFEDNLVFVKNRARQKIFDKKHNEPFFDLYYASLGKANFLNMGEGLGSTINTLYHEGPACIHSRTGQMYFTRVDYDGSEFNLNKDKVANLKIFKTTFQEGAWSEPQKTAFNSVDEASCHPAISSDGNTIVFASDRKGGYGKMDLYVTRFREGQWTEPENLGPEFNTDGNDWFPFLNERDCLTYASDGVEKKKGLEVLLSMKTETGWAIPQLMPYPINTKHDDFGFIMSKTATEGYLSSNRPGGAGKDDIYNFSSLKPLYLLADSTYNLLSLEISSDEQGKPIEGAIIKIAKINDSELLNFDDKIFDVKSYGFLDSLVSDGNGLAEMRMEEGYSVIVVESPRKEPWQKVLFNQGGQNIFTVALKDKKKIPMAEPEIVYIEKQVDKPQQINNVKVDVGAVIVLENIYYDYNSYKLTQGAKTELNQLVELMKENPNLKIQLSAHTDSRGNNLYNQELSHKRAQSAKSYLVSRGILSNNIVAMGYGESYLRNHCADNVFCTEAEHIYNRRTEVKILEK